MSGGGRGWRLVLDGASTGTRNMAADEALAESVRAGGPPVLRLYGWRPACVSFGRNQPARGHHDPAALAAAGLDVVRRPTGGRAVLHDTELTYSVICPDRFLGSPREAYRLVNRIWVEALAGIGVSMAAVHRATRPVALDNEPCFADPAEGEVTAAGRKLIGSAQVRLSGVLLQHGSLPLSRSPRLRALPADLAAALDGAPAYLEEFTSAGPPEVADALVTRWREVLGPCTPQPFTTREEERVSGLAVRYADPAWTWRR